MSEFDVLGLGCCAVDEMHYVTNYPAADEKVPVTRRERTCGGLTARALLAAAKLGGRCAYVAALGNNESSEFVRGTLSQAGIETKYITHTPDARPICSTVIVDQKSGTRNSFFDTLEWRGVPADWPAADLLPLSSVLLVDNYGGLNVVTEAAKRARALGLPVVADLEGDVSESMLQLVNTTDHVLFSRQYAQRITGQVNPKDIVEHLSAPHRVTIITDGPRGCWYNDKGSVLHQPAVPVATRNTTGCGDVFHGAYALALAQGMELRERVIFASVSAAVWASGALPTRQAVQRISRRQSIAA